MREIKLLTNPTINEVTGLASQKVIVAHNGSVDANMMLRFTLEDRYEYLIKSDDPNVIALAQKKGWDIQDLSIKGFAKKVCRGIAPTILK